MRATLLLLATVLAVCAAALANELPAAAESAAAGNNPTYLATTWRHWAYSRPITIGPDAIEQRLVRVPVSNRVFAHADVDLADLRVIDDSGNEIGYVLFSGFHPGGRGEHWYQTKMIDSGYVPGQYTQAVVETGNNGRVHNLVKIELLDRRNEFFAWAEISASPDYETWRTLRTRAPVYHFRETGEWQAMRVSYPPTRDRWLRLRLRREDEAVPIASLRVAAHSPADSQRELEDAGLELTLRQDSPAQESWWESRSQRGVRQIDGVSVETLREEFHRPLKVSASPDGTTWRETGRGLVYRLLSPDGDDGTVRESLQVNLGKGGADRFWRVAVLDGDDPPIDDLKVTLLRASQSVVFRPQVGRTFRLLYGHPRAKLPEYELGQLLDHDQIAAAPLGALRPEQENPAFVSAEPFSERHPELMWAALALAVLVLVTLAIKSLRAGPDSSS